MPNKKKRGFKHYRSESKPLQNNRGSRRKQLSNDQMQSALQSVSDGVSTCKAALVHGVPRTTLQDRVTGRVTHGHNPGPKPYLDMAEESELTSHLIDASKIGYGKTRCEVFSIVERYVKQKEDVKLRSAAITHGWWQKLLKRNPFLSL